MSATSAVVTGLSLATGIAREATDGVPIVKQVLGVAARIVGLAEQVDKNREDLHALADRAKKMEHTIATVLGDHEPEAHLLGRLTDMTRVLRAVEKHFHKHLQQGRVRRAMGYIFTVRKEVDRLRGEFDDRLRELEVAASIDTNLSAKRDARFNGEFRIVRHCEIELLRRITPADRTGAKSTITCHLATCDGSHQVVVVRQVVFSDQGEAAREHMEAHDEILERMSLVQNRHPNIAYVYGRNTGPVNNRFVVLKAGDIRLLDDVLKGQPTADIPFIGRLVAKLVDALSHLQKDGAVWSISSGGPRHIYLDKDDEPKIGILDDLYAMEVGPGFQAWEFTDAMAVILYIYCTPAGIPENDAPSAHLECTKWSTEIFGTLIKAGYRTVCQDTVFRRADIPRLLPLSQESRMYLRQSYGISEFLVSNWSIALLDLATGARNREGSFLYAAWYRPNPSDGHEKIDVYCYCIEYTVDAVYHSRTEFKIPISAGKEVRQGLGIPATDDDQGRTSALFHLKRFADPSAKSMKCTGWRPEPPDDSLWWHPCGP